MRYLISVLSALVMGSLVGQAAHAEFPERGVKIVVPFPAGGSNDVVARLLGTRLSQLWGQAVVIDNRGGGGGNVGAEAVARSPADGYTLLLTAPGPLVVNQSLYSKLSFNPAQDFTPIALIASVPIVLAVNPDVKAATVSELIALAKASPGSITFASAGNGSPQHLAGELFQRVAGVKMLHVPYKGSGPAMTDLVGGQVQSMIETAPAAQALIKGGKLRALATTTREPVGTLPGVPTAGQAGLKDFEVSSMFGIVAPAGTPAPVIAKISAALKEILAQQEVKDNLLAQGALATWTTPQEAAQAIRAESAKWAKVVKDGDIKGD